MSRQSPRWLAPVRASLVNLAGPVTWFFRDDDAGWADSNLWALADVFRAVELPLDVAAIPAEINTETARRLRLLVEQGAARVYQHGWAHRNHEAVGRRCEFGRSRTPAEQYADLAAGQALLASRLEGRAEPVFIPPWNRCTELTAALLADLGFAGLSRDTGGPLTAHPALREVGVRVDWARLWRQDGPVGVGDGLAAAVAEAGQTGYGAIGVMLHHAVMGLDELRAAQDLLTVIRDHPAVQVSPLATLIRRVPDPRQPDSLLPQSPLR